MTEVVNYNEPDDMVLVPGSSWDPDNTVSKPRPNGRRGRKPPPNGCLTLKVVYNRAWVTSAGRGSLSVARQRLSQVLAEGENIYNQKFLHDNQLGFNVALTLVKGKLQRLYEHYKLIFANYLTEIVNILNYTHPFRPHL